MSVQRILANANNAAAMAAVTASSILPADATAFPLQRSRQGTARAVLTGGYTGAEDTTVEIEIVSDAGTGLLSEPVFTGAGNGALSALAATGVPSQSFTLLLASLGTATKAAAADFYGVKLQAKATGAAGNGIEITVDRTGIVATPTLYSFLEAVKAGDSEHKGPEWDFGSYALTADGELDARTARLRFGNDPQVYRQYKTFVDGQWTYILDPPIVRDLPAETPVYALSGACGVTVTAGATVETYPSIITLFDLLNALKTRSNLIDVVGVVIEDQTPGGMAADELPLRTDAYALPASYSGNAAFPGMGAVTVPPATATEIVTLTCVDDAAVGGEVWKVKGTLSGEMRECVTAVPYGEPAHFGWIVPKVLPEQIQEPSGNIYVKEVSFASRPAGAAGVELCVTPLVAGAKAKAKTVEAIYTRTPVIAGCECTHARAAGALSALCLGVEIKGGTAVTLNPDYQSRLQAFYAWLAGWFNANTGIGAGRVYGARDEAVLLDKIESLFLPTLDNLFIGDPVAAALAAWDGKLVALQADLTSIASQTGFDADGWPTGAKLWKNGTVLTVGDYVKTDRADVEPVAWKVTGTYSYPAVGGNPPRTFDAAVTIQDPPLANTLVPDYSAEWPNRVTDDYITVGNDGANVYAVQLKIIPPTSQLTASQAEMDAFVRRYVAAMKEVLAIAGIVPKAKASSQRSDCWQPCDGEFEWRLNGMEYLPACTNTPYHSSVKKHDCSGNEAIVSTQEFGFIIRCACPERLMEGDRITLVIENDAQPPKTYAVGDTIKIPVIAAQALELAGGQDGNDTLTWTVRGSAGASWPDYVAPIGAEPLYDQAGLQFRATPGGVAFALGDQFQFDVAGGTWRWRRDGGAWSAAAVIDPDPADLADGVQLTFKPGPAPAFVAGDAWAFDVMQPHAPKRAIAPDRGAWRWSDNGGDWQVTFPAETPITAIALWHTCPGGTVFTATGFDAAAVPLWSRVLPYRPGLTVQILEEAAAVAPCHMLQITVANAPGGSLRWCWCGVPFAARHNAAIRLERHYNTVTRSANNGGEIRWENWLLRTELDALLRLIDACKSNQDEPVVLVPQIHHAGEALLARIGTDQLEIADVFDYQSADADRRRLSVTLPFTPILA